MFVQILSWLLVAFFFLLGSILQPRATRVAVGLFFIVMALGVNLVLTVSAPEQFVLLGAGSSLPFYRHLFRDIVVLNPVLLGLCGVLYETVVGVAILGKGRSVTWGLAGALLFLLVITPLNPATYPNLLFAAALAVLLRHRYDRSFVEIVRSAIRRRGMT